MASTKLIDHEFSIFAHDTTVSSPVASACSTSSSSASSSSSSSRSSSSSGGGVADDEEDGSTNASASFLSGFGNEDDDETTLASTSFFRSYYRDEQASSILSKPFTSLSTTSTKFSLGLDDLRRYARLGRNATIKDKCRLPPNISKADIHVQVDIDERARSSSRILRTDNHNLEEVIQEAIRDDLSAVYSADAKSAKLFLCVVIVVMADGSFFRTLSDRDNVIGLAEIGLVWRLFDADDLSVFNGGLIVKTEEVATSLFDLMMILPTRGRDCLLNRLVPRVANDIMSRIADANDELLVEI